MMLSSALLAVMLIMGCGLCSLSCRQRLNHYRQMALGVRYINHIEKILEHLPQHRGMANTFLNGDKNFLEKMTGMQQTLEQDLKTIDQYHAQHTVHADILARWQTIKSGWGSLKQNVQSLSASESFERHSALIGEVLYLISDAADHMSLSNHPESSVRSIIQTTFNLLPPIIENIGQARGIGSGAAARGTLLTAVRIKLEFLHERLGATASSAYSTIERCIQQNSLAQTSYTQISRDNISNSQSQTKHFLETMTHHLLGDKITISTSDYFSEGTTAFNSNLMLLGNITATLDQQISNTIPKLKTRYLWSITIAVGGTLVLVLMWWSVAMT
jgi:methyl-accepting chemotaxis protein